MHILKTKRDTVFYVPYVRSLLGGSGTSKEKIKIKRDDKFNKMN